MKVFLKLLHQFRGQRTKIILAQSHNQKITGSLLHGKRFSSRTVSGDIHLPGGTPEGECTISTVSGDANLRVEE